ncbi:hypothetical protein [Allokutzneria oryzae]|uniref:Uncharacterized protein n=1 Tax=Allokutzneria oryzae TaxID=1378989 RepID=A0ABV6ACP7_9PSEU
MVLPRALVSPQRTVWAADLVEDAVSLRCVLAVFDSTGSGNAIRAGVRLQEEPRRLQQETSLIQNCQCTIGIATGRWRSTT